MNIDDSTWVNLLISLALDIPAMILYSLLLGLAIWRMKRGESGVFIAVAAVSWMGLSILSKLYFTFVWPAIVDSMDYSNVEVFIRISDFALNLAYCFPILCLIIGLFPRQHPPAQNILAKAQP